MVSFVARAIIRLLEMTDDDTGSTLTHNCAQFTTRRLGRSSPNANYSRCHSGIPKTTIYVTVGDKNVYWAWRSVNHDERIIFEMIIYFFIDFNILSSFRIFFSLLIFFFCFLYFLDRFRDTKSHMKIQKKKFERARFTRDLIDKSLLSNILSPYIDFDEIPCSFFHSL